MGRWDSIGSVGHPSGLEVQDGYATLFDHQTIGRSSDNSPVGQRCCKGRFAQRAWREQPGKALVRKNFADHVGDFRPLGRIGKARGLLQPGKCPLMPVRWFHIRKTFEQLVDKRSSPWSEARLLR